MIDTRRTFIIWLIYAAIVFNLAVGLVYLDIPQRALAFDHSHLTIVLLAVYGLAEIVSGVQAWQISSENKAASTLVASLSALKIIDIVRNQDSLTIFTQGGSSHIVETNTAIGQHLYNLAGKSTSNHLINQRVLLDLAEEKLYRQSGYTEFFSERIVWIGIFATILGVILAFWPLLTSGFSIDMMRANIGGFFGGIAVAFIPTAASFLFKIALDVNTKIIDNGVYDIMEKITQFSEVRIVPFLERQRS